MDEQHEVVSINIFCLSWRTCRPCRFPIRLLLIVSKDPYWVPHPRGFTLLVRGAVSRSGVQSKFMHIWIFEGHLIVRILCFFPFASGKMEQNLQTQASFNTADVLKFRHFIKMRLTSVLYAYLNQNWYFNVQFLLCHFRDGLSKPALQS